MEQSKAAVQNLKPKRENLSSDLIAGLTFAVVNVPQAMAHALLAMVNPVFGIYTLMVAVPIGAIFTSSVYMNVSTTSALSVAAGSSLVDTPASQRIEALAVLVLLVGVIHINSKSAWEKPYCWAWSFSWRPILSARWRWKQRWKVSSCWDCWC